MTGGYTGSYIFSNTIFSLRMGIRSRLMGYVIAILALVFVVSKSFTAVSIIAVAIHPTFFVSIVYLTSCAIYTAWFVATGDPHKHLVVRS